MKIGLIGQGGHSKVIQDILLANKSNEIIGYFDDQFNAKRIQKGVYYCPIDTVHSFVSAYKEMKFVIAIGNNKMRKTISERLSLSPDRYANAFHPSAIISSKAIIGYGTVVMPNAVINAHAEIGDHAIINTSSVIEHDNIIGDFVHISPNVTLTGGVQVEEGAHVGAGATIIPNKTVGKWATIGAGATVINDIPENCTAVGIPAKVKTNEAIGGGTT